MGCSNCGTTSGVLRQYSSDVFLCLDCSAKWATAQQAQNQSLAHNAAMINYLRGQIDYVFGVGPSPRLEIPQPTIHTGAVVNNNSVKVSIDKSIVGTLNTGTVENLNSSLTNVALNVDTELANALKNLSEAVASEKSFKSNTKQEVIDAIRFLSDQAALPKEHRNSSVIKSVLISVERTVSRVANLATLWQFIANWPW